MQIEEDRLFETYFRRYAGRVHAYALRRADGETAQDWHLSFSTRPAPQVAS